MSLRIVDHIVETHQIAAARRQAGKPIWAHRVDVSNVFRAEDLTFVERRDAIVSRLRVTAWVKAADEFDELTQLVDELAYAEDPERFDVVWDDIYDLADYDRVWIKT